jgi:zinc protease
MKLEIGERTLDNGLTIIAVRNAGVYTYAAGLVLDVDMRDESAEEEGVGNLIGDCLDEGTAHRTGVELAMAVDELGGRLLGNASGGTVMCPAKNSTAALVLLREMVFEPAFAEREVKRVRDEILQEIEIEESDPRQVASLRFQKEVYGVHPFARPARGSAKVVASRGVDDLHRFHKKWFAPQGSYLAAGGPAEVETTLDELEAAFSDIDGSVPEHVRPEPPVMTEGGVDIHLPMDREQVHVLLGHPGIRRSNPDFYALSVMDHVLGTGPGFTSRISMRLRDELGLCYSVHAAISSSAGEEPGTFTAYIGTSPEHRQKAIDGFLAEIDRIREEKVTEKELHDVQKYLTGSYVFAFERNTQLARYAVRAKRFDLGFDHIERYPDLIRSVTRDDVQRVAQEYLRPEHMVRVSAGA